MLEKLFQFHKGTIKTYVQDALQSSKQNFNSIKVRLKQLTQDSALLEKLFQFHKGTIKTYQGNLLICQYPISIP